jgi:hypothetical protein
MERRLDSETFACERCGRTCRVDERRSRELIEQERLDHRAAFETESAPRRGRQRWLSAVPRDPATLATTPRYRYVRRTRQLCAACNEALATSEAQAVGGQRRAAATVGWAALALAASLLVLRLVWPGAYAALGLEHSGPFPPYVKTDAPPSATPYKPPFDSSTPMESSR